MKKIFITILLICMTLFTGCTSIFNNEIYNKSYNVSIDLEEFEDLITATVEKTSPAVVGVSNYDVSLTGISLASTGSGVIYDCKAIMKDGTVEKDYTKTFDSSEVEEYEYLVVTNRHVIYSKNTNIIKVVLDNGNKKIIAEVLGYDDKVDLAVVKFTYGGFIQPIEFANSDEIKSGNFAVAIGSPGGYDYFNSSTFGIISYPKRYMSDDTDGDGISDWDSEYIQHDVAINPGSSGGALVNIKGELIGINTLKLVDEEIDNMGFAIPSNLVKEIISYLEKGTTPKRYTLGITVIEVIAIIEGDTNLKNVEIPEGITSGLYVSEVDIFGKAFRKLQVGDIILEINNVPIIKTQEFRAELGKVLAGEDVILKVIRGEEELEVKIRI